MATITALVVGGTGGIGHAIALRLASTLPATSTLAISGRTKPATLPANITFLPLDATSMQGIKSYATHFKSLTPTPSLTHLVLTQGILSMAGRTETPEGIDRKMALHFYGRHLLIRELLPILKPDARVMIVLDGWMGSPDKLDWDDLDLKKGFSLKKAADHCVSMNDGMVRYWAGVGGEERLFVHAFPGAVNTGYADAFVPKLLRPAVKRLAGLALTKPEVCAERLLSGIDGKGWKNIDSKGKRVEKKEWTEEQVRKVVEHTWGVVEGALAKGV
ncbi:hypothetical protein OQA88_13499 [Cercophora sp. LCS_1]